MPVEVCLACVRCGWVVDRGCSFFPINHSHFHLSKVFGFPEVSFLGLQACAKWCRFLLLPFAGNDPRQRALFLSRLTKNEVAPPRTGGWRWTAESPSPPWSILERAPLWKGQTAKLVQVRAALEKAAPHPCLPANLDARTSMFTLSERQGSAVWIGYIVEDPHTGPPQNAMADDLQFCLWDCEKLTDPRPAQLTEAMAAGIPTMLFGKAAAIVRARADQVNSDFSMLRHHSIVVYIQSTHPTGFRTSRWAETLVHVCGDPSRMAAKVCHPLCARAFHCMNFFF